MEAVKADWAEELSGLQDRPGAIKYALGLQVAKPPNVIEFKEMCSRAPVKAELSLPPPRASQDVIDKALSMASNAVRGSGGLLGPIRRLRERELSGDKSLTKFQREFWRIALGEK